MTELNSNTRDTVDKSQSDRLLSTRPKEVVRAVYLLWLSIIIGLPQVHFEIQRTGDSLPFSFWYVAIVVFALLGVMNTFVWRGANWARYVELLVVIFSYVSFTTSIDEFSQYLPIAMALEVVALAIDALVIYFLFTQPGALWFRRAPEK